MEYPALSLNGDVFLACLAASVWRFQKFAKSGSVVFCLQLSLLSVCSAYFFLSALEKLHDNAGAVPECAPEISGDLPSPGTSPDDADYDRFAIPSMSDLGMEPPAKTSKFKGGEREALSRLETVLVS